MQMAANVAAPVMGLRTVFTDHSLGAFNDAAMIQLNKVIKDTGVVVPETYQKIPILVTGSGTTIGKVI